MALIDKDQVKAEIERIMERAMNDVGRDVCQYILAFLDTLEAEEKKVDIADAYSDYMDDKDDFLWNGEQLFDFARHFYELGLNSKK